MDLVATKELRHAGKQYLVGETFTATDRDGRILVAIGKAKPAPRKKQAEVKDAKREYKRRDLTAE